MDAATRAVWLSIGGALGVNARYWLAVVLDRRLGTQFPWATLTINVSGAFALGFLATVTAKLVPHHPVRLFCLVGFLGGYTTFSTFALEAHKLLDSGSSSRSLAYMFGSVSGGFVAVTLGILAARGLGFDSGPDPQRGTGAVAGLAATADAGAELAESD